MPSKRSAKPTSLFTGPTFPSDWSEFLSLLNSHRVKFVVVGGHAFSAYARPRMTEDLDVFVEASPANAKRLRSVLVEFGFGSAAPSEEVLAMPRRVFMLGALPYRIDILTHIDGVPFSLAWRQRVRVKSSIGSVPLISKRLLVKNKLAAGRDKDLLDVAALAAPTRRR